MTKIDTKRKRRKRATATGAASDCFKCNELHQKCDRTRPYCKQCLNHGKPCSGYKTALRWNVGVASRGRLRGLALPIAASQPQDQASENWDSMLISSSEPSDSSANLGTNQYRFANMNHHYSAIGMPPMPAPSALSNIRCQAAPQEPLVLSSANHLQQPVELILSANAVDLYHYHNSGILFETSPTATYSAASEQHHKDFSSALISVSSFNGEPFTQHGPMEWSQGRCSFLSAQQNSPDCLNLEPSRKIPNVQDISNDFRSDQSIFDLYGLPTNDETWVNAVAGINLQYVAESCQVQECCRSTKKFMGTGQVG